MINWIEGKPEKGRKINCCLVIYMNDYEFGRWIDDEWFIIYTDKSGNNKIKQAYQDEVTHYAELNHPE